jgi:SAM-dependent methyltransferase
VSVGSSSDDGPETPNTPGGHVSERWADWRRSLSIDAYEARFDQLAARGEDAHGEADLIASYAPASVLDAGCGTGRVAIELDRRGIEVVGVDLDDDMLAAARRKAAHIEWISADLAALALGRTFAAVAMPGNVLLFCRADQRADVVASCARHVEPGGRLIAGFSLERGPQAMTLADYDAAATASGLELEDRFATWERAPYAGGSYAVCVHRRPVAR